MKKMYLHSQAINKEDETPQRKLRQKSLSKQISVQGQQKNSLEKELCSHDLKYCD